MKFITAEQFLQADKKVQDSIMRWWQPEIGDLTVGKFSEVVCIEFPRDIVAIETYNSNEVAFPLLLTTQQLIDYIEWRTGYGLDTIEYGVAGCYWVSPYSESEYSVEQEMIMYITERLAREYDELNKQIKAHKEKVEWMKVLQDSLK